MRKPVHHKKAEAVPQRSTVVQWQHAIHYIWHVYSIPHLSFIFLVARPLPNCSTDKQTVASNQQCLAGSQRTHGTVSFMNFVLCATERSCICPKSYTPARHANTQSSISNVTHRHRWQQTTKARSKTRTQCHTDIHMNTSDDNSSNEDLPTATVHLPLIISMRSVPMQLIMTTCRTGTLHTAMQGLLTLCTSGTVAPPGAELVT